MQDIIDLLDDCALAVADALPVSSIFNKWASNIIEAAQSFITVCGLADWRMRLGEAATRLRGTVCRRCDFSVDIGGTEDVPLEEASWRAWIRMVDVALQRSRKEDFASQQLIHQMNEQVRNVLKLQCHTRLRVTVFVSPRLAGWGH